MRQGIDQIGSDGDKKESNKVVMETVVGLLAVPVHDD
jgi:hypothetical protein